MDESDHVASHLARNLAGLRHARALTQESLAKASGLPRSTIANLESGEGNPSLQVLTKVARALGVPLDELLAGPRAKTRLWTDSDIPKLARGRGVTVRPLVPEPVPKELLGLMEFAPDASLRGTPHLPGTREYFTCLEGHLTIFVAGERHDLAPGDVLGFPGNTPHAYQNPDKHKAARGVSIVILAKAGV
jgi:transcriptional regulator with XRE-family HTH domain